MREQTLMPAETADADKIALIRGIATGEAAALAELWTLYGARLHGYIASCFGGDGDMADDIVVQAMAQAVRCIRSFDPRRGNFTSWMYGITRRLIQNELRQRKRGGNAIAISLEILPDTDATCVSVDLSSRLDAQRQVRLLAVTLAADEMEVLVLHLVHGFSVREIAGLLGRSWRAIDSLLYRAREKARERLAQDET
jgi:RNA polymerase sigma factor (sigma-70 family)